MTGLIEQYLEYLVLTKNTSKNTISSYRRDLVRMHKYLAEKDIAEYKEVQYSHLTGYLTLLQQEGMANTSISRNIAALRGFFKYLELNQLVSLNPANNIRTLKVEQKLPVILSLEEVEAFLNQPNDSCKGIRDKAMLEVLYATGIRASELVGLTLGDVNLSLGFIQCDDGKKQRIIPIGKLCKASLEVYINESRCTYFKDETDTKSPTTPLFVNTRGNMLSRQGFWKIIKGYANDLGTTKDVSPHMLRHSFACHLIQNGADLKSVQEMMGHESIISTQVYTKVGEHKLKEVYLKAHPRA